MDVVNRYFKCSCALLYNKPNEFSSSVPPAGIHSLLGHLLGTYFTYSYSSFVNGGGGWQSAINVGSFLIMTTYVRFRRIKILHTFSGNWRFITGDGMLSIN